ncbi:hypothetical protein HLB23_15540 [Nocardia uniformis]|uniref:Uncharacterized protein n=1 Tax=Nocardia uniformis TaxID=53432 RepID=A0A849C609_9NOCA|nr:hypothetical protein [Nocardia uniformis]NNH71257.1 hypothetical protein [Nocardia uniformis]
MSAIAADDATRACAFVTSSTCEFICLDLRGWYLLSLGWLLRRFVNLLGGNSIAVIKALDGKRFLARTAATEGRAEYTSSPYFDLAYLFGRWYVDYLYGYSDYVN